MKLMRHGPKGAERPALVDAKGQVRDLSGVLPDITAATLTPERSRTCPFASTRAGRSAPLGP